MTDPRTELRDRIAAALAGRFTGRAGPLVADTYVAFADAVMELFVDVRPERVRLYDEGESYVPVDPTFATHLRYALTTTPEPSPSTESETP